MPLENTEQDNDTECIQAFATTTATCNVVLPEVKLFCVHNPSLQVAILYLWHVCSQHSFGLPLKENAQNAASDHVCLDLLLLII